MTHATAHLVSPARAAARIGTLSVLSAGALAAYEAHERLVSPEARGALLDRYRRAYCTELLRVFGVQWHLTPPPTAPAPGRGQLVVSNHRTVVDIALLVAAFGGTVLSRAEVARWPLLGRVVRRAGTILVDRERRGSGALAIRAIQSRLAAGETVIVFPEGGTHAGDRVRTFSRGAFAAARGTGARIVPVGLAYDPGVEYVGVSFGMHLTRLAGRPHTRVEGRVGTPLDGDPPSVQLAREARTEVQNLVALARRTMDAHE